MSDLSELFSRDPLNLTTSDIDAIIARYRQAREQYLAGGKAAGATKTVAKGDKQKLSLDDLGL